MKPEEIVELVRQDLAESELGPLLKDHAFRPLDGPAGRPIVLFDELTGQGAVGWMIEGRQTGQIGEIRQARRRVAPQIKLVGMTHVSLMEGGEPLFIRFFDWVDLHAQLGIVPSRQAAPGELA